MEHIFGKKLGQYIILDHLGSGGMAVVYNAFDQRIERNVAIKVILPSKRSSQVFQEQFEREARALANLTHTNIVKVLDYGIEQGQPYLVMEYVQGGTLKQAIKESIHWQKAAEILAPIARALDYVHAQKIVHRDVKPSNILLDEDDHPMLSDFGVVKLIEEEEQSDKTAIGVGVGTPDYMSPEQGMGRVIDYRADIYSLGVVFYEIITGTKPFTAESPMAVVIKHTTEEFPRPSREKPDIPRFVDDAILRAVQKEPDRRYATMGEFAEVLELIALGDHAPIQKIEALTRIPRIKTVVQAPPRPVVAKPATPEEISPEEKLSGPGGPEAESPLIAEGEEGIVRPESQEAGSPEVLSAAKEAGEVPEEEGTEADEEGTARSKFRFTQRSRWVLGSVLAVILVGIVLGSVLLLNNNRGAGLVPTVAAQMPTASPAANIPTKQPSTSTPAAAVATSVPIVQFINHSTLTLEGTPVPSIGAPLPKEIARWGIGGINEIAWSPDGKLIVLGTTSGIFIFDAQTQQRRGFIDTQSEIRRIAFFPDGQRIAAGSADGLVGVWNVNNGNVETHYTYQNPKSDRIKGISAVSAISIALDGQSLAVGYESGAINYYSLNNTAPVMAVEQSPKVGGLAISADGKSLYVANGGNSILVWDLTTQRKTSELQQQTPAMHLRFSRDRLQFLSGASNSPVVYLWDLSLGRIINGFTNLGGNGTDYDFSADNQLIAIGVSSGQVQVFNRPDLKSANAIQVPIQTLSANNEEIQSLAFAPSGTTLASGTWHEGFQLWNPQSGENLFTLDDGMYGINQIYFSQDGQWLISGHDNNLVRIWSVSSATERYHFDGYLPRGYPVSPDSRYVAMVHKAESQWDLDVVRVVELQSGQVVAELPGYIPKSFLRFTDDSKLLVMGTTAKAVIWDVTVWERLSIHGGPNGGCGQFFTPQNELLAVVADAGIFYEYDPYLAKLCGSVPTGAIFAFYNKNSSTGKFILGSGSLWGFAETGIRLASSSSPYPLPDKIFQADYSNNGWYASVATYYSSSNASSSFEIHNVNGSSMTIPNQDDYNYRVAFLPVGMKMLALGSKYGSIHIWILP